MIRQINWRVTLLAACAIIAFLCLIKAAGGQSFPNCTEFGFNIAHACCCTNGCCRETDPGEVQHVDGDTYRIVPTGQLIKRTGWSPDGRTIRCACDHDPTNNTWVSHPKASTRCLYLPMPSS